MGVKMMKNLTSGWLTKYSLGISFLYPLSLFTKRLTKRGTPRAYNDEYNFVAEPTKPFPPHLSGIKFHLGRKYTIKWIIIKNKQTQKKFLL
jgi:hypothetical protein